MITHHEQVSSSLSSEALFFNKEGTHDNNIDIDIDPDYEIHNSTSPTCSLEMLSILGVRKKENIEKMELDSNCYKTLVLSNSTFCCNEQLLLIFSRLHCKRHCRLRSALCH